MDQVLKSLYDKFYTSPTLAELEQEIETNRQQLMYRLDKPERKLLLRIIDAKDSIAADLSLDSFICGFQLAWRLSNELYNYQDGGSVLTRATSVNTCSILQGANSE